MKNAEKKTAEKTAQIIPGAEPFFFPADGPVGCLLVHGFTSTTYDVRTCGEYLAKHGISSMGVLLAGHGTSPKDLAKTDLSDWLESVRKGYEELRKKKPVIFALGISLAGNLLVSLIEELELEGLILVGMPLKFRHERSFTALYYAYRALGIDYQRKWYQKTLDPEIRRARPNYHSIPIKCAKNVLRAIKNSRTKLPNINCPVYAIQSTTDHAVDLETIDILKSQVGSKNIEVEWVPNRYHVVLIDHDNEKIFEKILSFINKYSPQK